MTEWCGFQISVETLILYEVNTMGTQCDFNYCLHNKEFICTLKKIQVNCIGMCASCITAVVPEEMLEQLKQDQLREVRKIFGL